jgi:hypothetical protein
MGGQKLGAWGGCMPEGVVIPCTFSLALACERDYPIASVTLAGRDPAGVLSSYLPITRPAVQNGTSQY